MAHVKIITHGQAHAIGRNNKQAVNNNEGTIIDGKALVASYNNVHWEVGHYMKGEPNVGLTMCNN